MSPLRVAIVLAVLVVQTLAWWYPNRPRSLPQPTAWPIESVSFAPFRKDQSPLTKDFPRPEEIEADLALLQGKVKRVRTYTSLEGMDAVPRLAGKYGIKVIHSAWLSDKRPINERETAALIAAANAHPQVIERVIVGNEVLLRKDLPRDELIVNIRKVKAAVKQPVGYAEVWEFWMQNPEVANHVDFIAAHLLPYWEDDPHGVERAMPQVLYAYQTLQKRFPGKPILVGEVGWPSAGRSRADARPSLYDQAR
ncbi:MAG: exo-beta-1,3-glucanase, partial [Alphaproteobacteria bacterium]|nr:exo-beta-1,3-glucanase [Alphaproteobacteria bacterium]